LETALKYTNIFHRKALQNIPEFGFLVCKNTIWQPFPKSPLERDAGFFLATNGHGAFAGLSDSMAGDPDSSIQPLSGLSGWSSS
jgi:hypothetical protein